MHKFDGGTYCEPRDGARLSSLLERVRDAMSDGNWHTLEWLAKQCGGTEASVSARLRDLRKGRFGAHIIDRIHLDSGLWAYRMPGPRQMTIMEAI